jgi:hypothetical protein
MWNRESNSGRAIGFARIDFCLQQMDTNINEKKLGKIE